MLLRIRLHEEALELFGQRGRGTSSGSSGPQGSAAPLHIVGHARAIRRAAVKQRSTTPCAPQSASSGQRERAPAVAIGAVVLEVDRGGRAVVLAARVHHARREAAHVLGPAPRARRAPARRCPLAHLRGQARTPDRRRSCARAPARAGSGRTSASRRARTPRRSARTSRASARCRAPRAVARGAGWSTARRCATRPPRSWPASRSARGRARRISATWSSAIARLRICARGRACSAGLPESP